MNNPNPCILKVSKNKHEKPLNLETFCMDALMEELLIYVKNELKIKEKSNIDVEIFKLTNYEKCLVHTDRVKLRQIFTNLLDIAVKFTDTGFIIFGYHTSVSNNMNLFVEDTGIGIYSDDGYGLTIAQGLVEQLGGEMEVECVENAGMSVDFNIICQPCEIFEN